MKNELNRYVLIVVHLFTSYSQSFESFGRANVHVIAIRLE